MECKDRYNRLKNGRLSHSEELTKNCIICGKEFKTWRSTQLTCSPECSKSKKNHKEYDKEYEHQKYVKKNPGALTQEERNRKRRKEKEQREAKIREQREKQQQLRLAEKQKRKEQKEKQKQENIAQWIEYKQEHICVVCGNKYTAHSPKSKYCSTKCSRMLYRTTRRKRLKGKVVDNDITLMKLSNRDNNQCQICGLFVDWNDKTEKDGTVVCGNMYPSIDHIFPVSKGGLHSWENIRLAHRICNCKKSNKAG